MTNPSTVLDLIEAFRRSKTMFAAVKLGVCESTPATAAEITARLGTSQDGAQGVDDGSPHLRQVGPVDGLEAFFCGPSR